MKEPFENIVGKGEPACSPFSTMYFTKFKDFNKISGFSKLKACADHM